MFLLIRKSKILFSLLMLSVFLIAVTSCKKKEQVEEQEETVQSELDFFKAEMAADEEYNQLLALLDFYSPALDNGSWVEELLAHVEEERIAEELASMEESLESMSEETIPAEPSETEIAEEPLEEPKEAELSAVEKFFNEEKSGTVVHGKNNELKFYEFENEIFLPQRSDGKLVNVHVNGNSVDRYFYDEKYKLVKKESWNIPSVQSAALEKTENYEYFADSSVISKKTIETKSAVEKISYSQTSKILSSEKHAVTEDKNQILSKRKLGYDAEDRLCSDELTDYYYKDKDYKELDYSFTKKYIYTFNEGEIPPDFKYYENGVLKMQNKYSPQKGNYVSEIFFDETFSVKTYYENDVRVKDIFYSNGKISREKIYEKKETEEVEVEKK